MWPFYVFVANCKVLYKSVANDFFQYYVTRYNLTSRSESNEHTLSFRIRCLWAQVFDDAKGKAIRLAMAIAADVCFSRFWITIANKQKTVRLCNPTVRNVASLRKITQMHYLNITYLLISIYKTFLVRMLW